MAADNHPNRAAIDPGLAAHALDIDDARRGGEALIDRRKLARLDLVLQHVGLDVAGMRSDGRDERQEDERGEPGYHGRSS